MLRIIFGFCSLGCHCTWSWSWSWFKSQPSLGLRLCLCLSPVLFLVMVWVLVLVWPSLGFPLGIGFKNLGQNVTIRNPPPIISLQKCPLEKNVSRWNPPWTKCFQMKSSVDKKGIKNVSRQNSSSQNVCRQNTSNLRYLKLPHYLTQLRCEGNFKLWVLSSLLSSVFYWTGCDEPLLELLAGVVPMGRGSGILTRDILSRNILTGGIMSRYILS